MTVSELESKLAKFPQTAKVAIQLGDHRRDIKEIMYEELEYLEDGDEDKECFTLMG